MRNMFCNLLFVAGLSCVDIVSGCNTKTEANINISDLAKSMEQVGSAVQRVMSTVPSDATRVLFLGTTGIGKSTLINYLMGSKLKVKRGECNWLILEPIPQIDGFEVGHRSTSETTVPNAIYNEQDKLVYCDCPGFGDTRGAQQEILNAFAIDQILTFSENTESKAKILLLMSANQGALTDGRGESAKKIFDRIIQVIPDKNKLEESVALVLRDGTKESRISFFKFLEEDEKTKGNWLVSYLKTHSSSQVFNIPPISKEQENKEIDIYEKDRLIEWLQQNPVCNIPHNIILGTEECACILGMLHKLGKPEDTITELGERISALLDSENDIEKIGHIGSFIDEINVKVDSPTEFINLFMKKHTEVDEFNLVSVIDQMRKFEALYGFMKKICEKMQSSEEASRYFDFEANIEDYYDITKSYAGVIANCQSVKKRREEFVATNMKLKELTARNEEVEKKFGECQKEIDLEKAKHDKAIEDLEQMRKQNDITQKEYDSKFSEMEKERNELCEKNTVLTNMHKDLQKQCDDVTKQLVVFQRRENDFSQEQGRQLRQAIEDMRKMNEALSKPSWSDILAAMPAAMESATKSICVLTKLGCEVYAFAKSFDKK